VRFPFSAARELATGAVLCPGFRGLQSRASRIASTPQIAGYPSVNRAGPRIASVLPERAARRTCTKWYGGRSAVTRARRHVGLMARKRSGMLDQGLSM